MTVCMRYDGLSVLTKRLLRDASLPNILLAPRPPGSPVAISMKF